MRWRIAILRSSAAPGRRRARRVRPQCLDEQVAALGHDVHRIGREQLVVTERRGDRPRAGARILEPRLDVVLAVAAGLEAVDAHRLLARKPGGGRDPGVGPLELGFAVRPMRREAELVVGRFQEIGNDRDRRPGRPLLRAAEGSAGFDGPE